MYICTVYIYFKLFDLIAAFSPDGYSSSKGRMSDKLSQLEKEKRRLLMDSMDRLRKQKQDNERNFNITFIGQASWFKTMNQTKNKLHQMLINSYKMNENDSTTLVNKLFQLLSFRSQIKSLYLDPICFTLLNGTVKRNIYGEKEIISFVIVCMVLSHDCVINVKCVVSYNYDGY